MGKSNTRVELRCKMADPGKTHTGRAHEHDKTKYRWPLQAYTNVLNSHAPIKSKRCRNAADKSKFITPDIKKAMWKRNALKRKFNKTRSADDWEAYRSQRNRVVALRR